MAERMRVQKFLSKAGVASRRKSEDLMVAGRVVVNGEPCTELGSKVDPASDTVEVDGELVTLPDSYIYILLNKPRNYITTLDDPHDRPIVTDLLPEKMPRIWPAGRLDWDSEGLLLLTNDGKLTNLLTHPSHDVPKTYAVKVRGHMDDDSRALQQLQEGVEIESGYVTQPAHVAIRGYTEKNTWMEFTIVEGKNRQIRRMCEAVEFRVQKLRRIAIGKVTIEKLPAGHYRPLLSDEVLSLYELCDANAPERAKPSKRAKKREKERKKHNRKYDIRKK